MRLNISDPRQYSNIYPDSNMILNQAILLNAGKIQPTDLLGLVKQSIKNSNDQLISIAYNLAPNAKTSKLVWDNLLIALQELNQCQIFAIPVVLVVGSKKTVKLPAAIDTTKLNEILLKHNFITNSGNAFISGNLVSEDILVKINPSQLYQICTQDIEQTAFINKFNAKPIQNYDEGVYIRFFIGYTNNQESICFNNYSKASMEIMSLLASELKTEGSVIYPIPFGPCYLAEALVLGNNYYQDILFTLNLSNSLKELRGIGKHARAHVYTSLNTIHVDLVHLFSYDVYKSLTWQIGLIDDFEAIAKRLLGILQDMQLEICYGE